MSESSVLIRAATEADLPMIAELVDELAVGHPSASHPRPLSKLKDAYFNSRPVARLFVATRNERIVGMAQWIRVYDMFWAAFGGEIEWLYVRREARGTGIAAAIVAEICRDVRLAGGELLKGGAEADENAALYERVAKGWACRTCYVSAEAFQAFADLAGLPPREIVRRLPDPALNLAPARARS